MNLFDKTTTLGNFIILVRFRPAEVHIKFTFVITLEVLICRPLTAEALARQVSYPCMNQPHGCQKVSLSILHYYILSVLFSEL